MSSTGIVMLWFITAHMLGNTLLLHGPAEINSYSSGLHILPTFLMGARLVLLLTLALHVSLAVMLTLENRKAAPQSYAVKTLLRASFAGETMIWSGLLILCFIIYHLLHFTFRTLPGVVLGTDAQGRFDVFTMVVMAFRGLPTTLIYLGAVGVLYLHLSHGVQGIFQTFGMNNEKAMPWIVLFGKIISAIFLVGYGILPVIVRSGVGVFAR